MSKVLWLFVGAMMVFSLAMSACGPAAPQTTSPPATSAPKTSPTQNPAPSAAPSTPAAATPTAENPQQPAAKPTAEKPQYGGTYTTYISMDPQGFDESMTLHFWIFSNQLTNEMLLEGDWSKGPAGSGEFSWTSSTSIFSDKTPVLCTGFEIPEIGHIIWHIRPGIHFGLNPNSEASRLVGGRELTAQDIAFTLNRILKNPRSYIARAAPVMAKSAVFTTPDKYTVDLKVDPSDFYNCIYFLNVWTSPDYPPEVIKKYGDMNSWQNVVGTGPFFLTDYVPGSELYLARNPNFWMTDPVGPGKGQQLPYVDAVRELIIPDTSTVEAALRTGKIDEMGGVNYDDYKSFMQTDQHLQSVAVQGTGMNRLSFRIDKPNLPQYDIRVREALSMAVDYNSIIKNYFEGQADMRYSWPVGGGANIDAISKPLSERSTAIQELFSYQPDKAKELLKEAGYPNGFKIQVDCQPQDVDYLSIIKDYWQKVGVEMDLNVLSGGTWTNVLNNRRFDEAIYAGGYPGYIRLGTFVGDNYSNASFVNDPYINSMVDKLQQLFFDGKQSEVDQIYRDQIADYVLSQAWVIPTPGAKTFNLWWPWLKNYYGARSLGWTDWPQYAKYVWIDRNLKKSMGY